jgi:hypothetical protein
MGPFAANNAATALAAANGAADAAVAAGTVTSANAAATGIVAADGTVAVGTSGGAGGVFTNPTVQALYKAVPDALRKVTTGRCGEACGFGNLVNAGVTAEGSIAVTIRIASRKVIEACPACKFVAEKLGAKTVGP